MSEPNAKKSRITPNKLVVVALLTALEIILTRLLSVQTPVARIGLGFVPVSLAGILYGPLWAAAVATAADLIGVTLFPTAAFFPGFTLTAFLTGLVYGLFLHRRSVSLPRVIPAAALICLVLNLGLDSFWLYLIMGKGVLGYLPLRAAKAGIMLALQIVLIPAVWKYVGRFIPEAAR